jgi:hypothetical protein
VAAVAVDPDGDLGGVEAEEVAPLDARNATLVDEASDMTDVDTQLAGDLADADESTGCRRRRGGHEMSLLVFVCLFG